MKLLITGGTGFIGSHLLRLLSKREYELWALVRKDTDTSSLSKLGISFYTDNGDIKGLIKFMRQEHFEGVIHLAALILKEHSSEQINNLCEANLCFPLRLLEASVKSDLRFFINTGTFWQNYGNQDYNPANLYAATKQAFIDLARYYMEFSNLKFITLKLHNTYGPGDKLPRIFNLWRDLIETGDCLAMTSGKQHIDMLHVYDCVAAFEVLLNQWEHLELDEYVLRAEKSYRLKDLARLFEKISGAKLNIKWDAHTCSGRESVQPYKRGEVPPNWAPKITIENGLKEFLKKGKINE